MCHHNNVSDALFKDKLHKLNKEEKGLWSPLTEKETWSFVTQEAIDRTDDMHYDNSKHCIDDPLIDINLEFVIEDDTIEQLLGPDTEDIVPTVESNIPDHPALRVLLYLNINIQRKYILQTY